jgi:1-acyl-sn-glycerol-3-phosphate acyltransferase
VSKPQPYPAPPEILRHARGVFWRVLGRIYLRAAGWRFEGTFPVPTKCVFIVAPHTSNWDFVLGMAVVFGLELRVSWLGKDTIFRWPFKRFMTYMGGIPVDRSASHGVVGECVQAIQAAPAMYLAVAPEGTRKGSPQWKTGFYFIASQAGVPILPVTFDFRERVVYLLDPFHPTGDLAADLPRIQALFAGRTGCRATRSSGA